VAGDKLPKFVLVEPNDQAYRLVAELVPAFHDELVDARIVLVWENDIKADCDGHLVMGRAKKFGPLDQATHPHDFAILLNAEIWRQLPEIAKRAVLDHELSHCGTKTSDQTGEVSYYIRKHDLEEFNHIVRRYGLWREGVETFIKAALKQEQAGLFKAAESGVKTAARELVETVAGMPAVSSVTISSGGKSVTLKGGQKS